MELIINGLTKQYKKKMAVDSLSITLTRGVYGLLGANGAGKTTLIRMLCGVLKPTSGDIKFNGIDVGHEDYRDALGYLPQDFGYYPEFSAMEFLLYMSNLKGLTKQRAKDKSHELLALVSLTDMAKKKIKTFSGGMKQRLGIAQALLNNPKILILDEPTAGLDPKERVKFRNLMAHLGAERMVLLSTHIVSDVENIANTILIMKEGKLINSGRMDEIITIIENKVYECSVDNETGKKLMSTYPVINIRQESHQIFLRLVADNPPCQGAVSVPAALEDLYLYYFREVNANESFF